jgi:predicted PurR-regulated permease PerM
LRARKEARVFETVLKNPWVRAALALAAIAGALVLAWLLRPVLAPLFFAFLVAYVFDPLVDRLEKFGIGRMVTIVALAALAIAVILAGPLLLLPGVIAEADHLVSVARERVQSGVAGDVVGRALGWLPLRSFVEAAGWAPADQADYDPLAVIVAHVGENIRNGASDFLENYGSRMVSIGAVAGGGIAGMFAAIGRAITGFLLAIGNIVLFAVVAGYLLRDYDGIIAAARDLVPPRHRERTFSVASKIDGQLRGFMRGQALVCLALGVLYSVGLVIADVPFGLALGLFGGAASFVPYLGLILTAVPAGILCIVAQGGIDWHLAVVVLTFVGAQALEGTVITPRLVGEQVGLGPVWVILAVLVFGNALGFLGLLLAVPIAATLKVLVLEGVDAYRRSPAYVGALPQEQSPALPKKRAIKRKTKSRGSAGRGLG